MRYTFGSHSNIDGSINNNTINPNTAEQNNMNAELVSYLARRRRGGSRQLPDYVYTDDFAKEISKFASLTTIMRHQWLLGEIQERRRAERMLLSNGVNMIEVNKKKIKEMKPEIKTENLTLRKVS